MENKNNASYDYITYGNKTQTNKFYKQGGHETDTERQNNQDDLGRDPGNLYVLYKGTPSFFAGRYQGLHFTKG